MKPFKFFQIDKRLNKKSHKQVQQERMRQNFLKLYEDIPVDSKMQRICEQAKQIFDQRRKNNRYYSFQTKLKNQHQTKDLRTQGIKKLSLYEMPYRSQMKQIQNNESQLQSQKIAEKLRKKALFKKMIDNIKLIVNKMKKLKITMQDIIQKDLFSKQPYKFGSEIFVATKEGNLQKVRRIVMENKFSIFSIDNANKTIIFWSCIRGHPKITQYCIDVGMDINRKDIYGKNPLSYAMKYNHQECVKVLMLSLARIQQDHQEESKLAGQKIRTIFNLASKLQKLFKRMTTQQRRDVFEQQYQYINK